MHAALTQQPTKPLWKQPCKRPVPTGKVVKISTTSTTSPSSHCNQFHLEWSSQSHFQLFLQESLTCSQEHLQCQNSQGCSTWWWITLMSPPDPHHTNLLCIPVESLSPMVYALLLHNNRKWFHQAPSPSISETLVLFSPCSSHCLCPSNLTLLQ